MDRIRLGNDEFEGRNNAYVLAEDGGDGLALVDTGLATPDVREDLRDGLAERGYDFADVDDIVLTHFHVDHAGLAGEIQAASDATVYVHEADAPLVEGDADAYDAIERRRRDLLERWGVPEESRAELAEFMELAEHLEGEPADATPIEGGTVLEVGGRTLETIHAPGHAAGHCCFEICDASGTHREGGAVAGSGGEAFVGDALLPVYTPNVGGADVRIDRPLERYYETLERLAEREYDRVWPGHREPIAEPTARAREIIAHHRERSEKILEILREHGPADAWTVSDHLFGDLEGIHIVHGPGEAYAHLDHLEHEGVLDVDDGIYRLVDAGAEADAIGVSENRR
ncbi:MBL fold metallo-hydrolase [Natronolimnohabitans innermongolicus]|uniref:Beta-lactamase n=1 Tax=Natronolimnohabitans innermongolicus JCM 12255 TaxID=1227499 RepID=L9XHI5_9EURY|nr:MBL fold metallo-hydrolase [Natronolimnohabitans innermongolicus]ELY61204.1 beta-lactamase [Natronolimnohabitans innermongolicus JCM 12255]